jgi:hypothetical protein
MQRKFGLFVLCLLCALRLLTQQLLSRSRLHIAGGRYA